MIRLSPGWSPWCSQGVCLQGPEAALDDLLGREDEDSPTGAELSQSLALAPWNFADRNHP
jgi:hypothetical protein